jgi:hypothetical protein
MDLINEDPIVPAPPITRILVLLIDSKSKDELLFISSLNILLFRFKKLFKN